jgi:hypothetical protein
MTQRVVKRFAFFPTRIDDTTVIWLEWYLSLQTYTYGSYDGQRKWQETDKLFFNKKHKQ